MSDKNIFIRFNDFYKTCIRVDRIDAIRDYKTVQENNTEIILNNGSVLKVDLPYDSVIFQLKKQGLYFIDIREEEEEK